MRQPNRRFLGLGQLGRRLALIFVGVALAAIAVDALVSAETLGRGAASVAAKQEKIQARAIALGVDFAYKNNGWSRRDLMPVMDLADRAGAGLRLRSASGHLVCVSPDFSQLPTANARTLPVVDGPGQVGRVTVRFGPHGIGGIAASLAAERWHARLISVAIASLIALVVSILVARAISGPLELVLEAVRVRGAGGRSMRIAKVRGTGVVRELLQSFNDAANALDEQERLQRDLVAKLAHELRTPVAVLQASQEAMLDGVAALSPENIGSQRDETLRLGKRIEDLQRLAEAESAALRLKLDRHDLAVLAAEAAASLRGAFATSQIRFDQRLEPAIVRCDADRIRQIILNLLTNAVNFTPPGGKVRLESSASATGGGLIMVTDSGVGIREEDLPRVTERFYRGMASPDIVPGSGVGLAIVAELAHAHGGDVAIASEPGHGTTVTVTIPS